jgi:hypothetical protein
MKYKTEIWTFNGYGFDKTTLIVDITLLNKEVVWQW